MNGYLNLQFTIAHSLYLHGDNASQKKLKISIAISKGRGSILAMPIKIDFIWGFSCLSQPNGSTSSFDQTLLLKLLVDKAG